MPTAGNADVVWVDVLPSLVGFAPKLRAGLRAAGVEAAAGGSAAGRAFGASFGTSAAAAVEAASTKVAVAQKRAADATGRLTVAQTRLTELTDKSTASASRLAAAEEAVAKAQRNLTLQTDAVARAEAAQARVQADVTASTTVAADRQALLATRMGESELAAKSLRGSMGLASKTLTAAFTLTLPAIPIVEAVRKASEFNAAMTRIQTQAGATRAEIVKLSPAVLNMASKLVTNSPEELATSLYHVYSTGLRSKQALDVVATAAKAANVAGADLEETTNALTATVASGIGGFKNYDQAVGALNATVGAGDMKLSDLNEALGSGLLARVKLFGVNLTDVGAALATFGDNNVRGADAATMLRTAVEAFAVPARGGQKILDALGLKAGQLAKDLQQGGLNQAVTDLRDHLLKAGIAGDQVGAIITQAFGKKAGGGVALLIGQYDRLQQKYEEVKAGQDGFTKSWEATTKTAAFAFASLKSSVEVLGIRIGNSLLPPLSKVADWLSQTGVPAIENFGRKVEGLFHSTAVSGFTSTVKGLFDGLKSGVAAVTPVIGALAGDVGHLASQFVGSGGLHDLAVATGAAFSGLVGAFRGVSSVAVPAVGGLVHAFGSLPGEVQAAVVAFGLLRLGMAANWFDGIALRALYLGDTVKAMGVKVVASLGLMKAAYRETAAQAAFLSTVQGDSAALAGARGALAGLGAAAGTAARGGLAAMRTGASGLLRVLGGPWIAGLLAAGVGVAGLVAMIKAHNAAVEKSIRDVQQWNETIALGMGGQAAIKAGQNLDELRQHIASLQKQIASAGNQPNDPSSRNYIDGLRMKLKELQNQLDQGNAAWKRQAAAMTPVEEATQRVKIATQDMTDALHNNPPNSHAVAVAAQNLADANANLATETSRANDAQKTQIKRLQEQASSALTSIQNGIAAQQAQQGLNDTITQFNKDAATGQVSAAQLSEEQSAIAQSAISAAQAAGTYAASQAKAKGVTDTTNAANQAQLQVLEQVAKQMGTATPTAILQAIQALHGATIMAGNVNDAVSKMGLTAATESDRFRKEFQGNATVLKGVTDGQIKDLQDLGYTVVHLPNHQIVVAANTQAARDAITQLTKDYHNYSINLGVGGIGGRFAAATGAVLPGWTPGRDVHRFTSPTAGVALDLSGGEGIARPEVVQAMGPGRFMGLNAAARSGGVSGVRKALGFAAGGMLPDWSLLARVGIDPGSLAAAEKQLAAAARAFAPGVPSNPNANALLAQRMGAALGWGSGAEWAAWYALGQRESGWRNTAQNPTSTAYGIAQFLDSTWATVGLRKTSDAATQILGMERYIKGRYGDPIGAWGHETRYGWYHGGGPVEGPPGATVPAYVQVGERVQTAPEDRYTQRLVTAALNLDRAGSSPRTVIYDQREVYAHVDYRQLSRQMAKDQAANEWLASG